MNGGLLRSVREVECIAQRLAIGVAAHSGDRFGKRNIFRADADTILRVATVGDPPFLHQPTQPLRLLLSAGGMTIEEAHLSDDLRPDKWRGIIHLRACFDAAAAGHACRETVEHLLDIWADAGSRPFAIGAVRRNPGVHLFQVFKHRRSIDDEIADERKLSEGSEGNGRRTALCDDRRDQCGARLSWDAVDQHRAGAAHFFEAPLLPDDGSDPLIGAVNRVLLDLHQGRDDIG